MGSEPEIIKRRPYGVRKLDFIRQALAGYAGGSAIVSEMLQNADDVGASKAMFQFRPQDFLAWNDSLFTDQDWENLTSIASGGRRNEEGKIGTWGTGFLSVFHLTDIPEVNSAGEKLILDPREELADVFRSDIKDGTGFRMAWRREQSDISRLIEADVWSDENIQVFKDDLAISIYRQIVFLRNVNSIEVYEGNRWQEKLLFRVSRTRRAVIQQTGYRSERWDIEYQRTGVQSRLDSWLYYRGNVPSHMRVEGVKPKDTEIGIAFPIENRDWLAKNLPGTLYNFLPTPIQTGYNFHINGAFFPDNNRQTILIDQQTQREKSHWNLNVIEAIGDLFVEVLSDIRDRLIEPRRFYEILPIQPPPQAQLFLRSIYESFCQTAPNEKIVFSSLGTWSEPGKVAIGRPGSRLPELVADYLPIVPSGVPQAFRDFLTYTLKVPFVEWKDAIALLKGCIQPGVPVADAHTMINSIEKLWLLYSELPVNPTDEQRKLFADVAVCLGDDGRLWPFSCDIWRASEHTRSLLANSGLLFVSLEAQKQFSKLFENLVIELRGASYIEWLARQVWPKGPISLSKFPALLESLDHLENLIEFFYADIQRISRDLLRRLPIIYAEDGCLYTAEDRVYFHKDTAERSDLQPLGLQFVHPDWAENEEIRAVYERAGISDLTPRHLIQALREHSLTQTDPELIQKLLKIYSYLSRNKGQIDGVDKSNLLSLPLCLTQHLRLTSVQEEQNRLHLPGDEALSKSPALRSLDKLQLDNLIHSDVLDGRSFLTQVLGLSPLSEDDLIRDVILKHYHDQRLNDTDRRNLLSYISEQLRFLHVYQQNELWSELQAVNLILCSDGEYHAAGQVYFASPAIETVFGSKYLKLHSTYQVPVPETDDTDQVPYRQSIWYWLFKNLGINESPSVPDLILAIEQFTRINPPEETMVEAVRRLYDFLNSDDNKTYLNSPEIQRLAGIAWLPARNRNDRWYFPREIYQASLGYLIGEQAPMLPFRESREQLRSVLGMPRYPEVGIVAKHLLDLAQKKKPLEENDLRIYQDLGNRWHDLSSSLQQNFKTADVVWSPSRKRYWRPDRVFLANFSYWFGDRRSYLDPPGGDAQKFLSYLGVRDEPHSYNDSIDLLSEIALDYADGALVSDADIKLVYANLDRLSQFENHQIYDRLSKTKFMPANDGLLYEPARIALIDRRDLLGWFEGIGFPRLDQEKLTEPVYKLLIKSGMPVLSELTHRELVHVDGKQPDTILNNQIPHLKLAFQRVALGAYKGNEESEKRVFQAIDLLVNLGIFSCDKIVVQYSLQNQNGWHTPGHQNTDEKSLLDKATNSLYVHRVKGKLDNVQLALEIENLLFPGSKASIVIENLLEKKLAEIDDFLDRHGYPTIFEGGGLPSQTSLTQGELDTWKIPNEPTVEDEEGTNMGTSAGAADTLNELVSPIEPAVEVEPKKITAEPAHITQPNKDDQPLEEISESDEINGQPNVLVPAFTGRTRPTVPILPNNYDDLHRRYGLKLNSTEQDDDGILNSDRVASDQEWINDKDIEKENGVITSTRFTLTYKNRYEGFLPLHQRAKQMFPDYPPRLVCDTDFPQWTFDLYIDYESQVIHNQHMLPQFFEAFNIPAGGIVYLERVHGNRCRLFWKQVVSQIGSVICLELLEDGTLNEYEISSTEFPCELSEYVFRSEKRLEDIEALFRQAIGKKGLFQTICDVFGEAGRVLSFNEIFHGVMKIRQVAQASIYFQLNQRPCFVQLDDGRWRFDPERGAKFDRKKGDEAKQRPIEVQQPVIEIPNEQEKPGATATIQVPSPSATSILMIEIRREWALLSEFFKVVEEKQQDELGSVIDQMIKLANRWQASLQALVSQDALDNTLAGFWHRVAQQPHDQKTVQLLEQRLCELLNTETIDKVIAQLGRLLAGTSEDSRQIFHKLLSVQARKAFEQECFDQALHIYQFLEKQDAGDFREAINEINKQKDVQAFLDQIYHEQGFDYRLMLLQEAWKKYPDYPSLRRTIQEEVYQSTIGRGYLIQESLEKGEIISAYQIYSEWSSLIWPLLDGWKYHDKTAATVWEVVRKTFVALYNQACTSDRSECYDLALRVANTAPLEVQRYIPAPDYVAVLIESAQNFERRDEVHIAAALMEYGLHLLSRSKRGLERYLEYQVNEYTGRLFEQLELIQRADYYLHRASKSALPDQQKHLSHRRYSLSERIKVSSEDERNRENGAWRARLESLANQKKFVEWIDLLTFKTFIDQTGL